MPHARIRGLIRCLPLLPGYLMLRELCVVIDVSVAGNSVWCLRRIFVQIRGARRMVGLLRP